jgi:hypothetical protein
MTGRLLTVRCTTGWLDWIYGELWLLPEGLLRIRTGRVETVAYAGGVTMRREEVVRDFEPGEPERIGAQPHNLWIPAFALTGAQIRLGLTAGRLRLSLADGRTIKLLWPKQDRADQPLRAALGRWGVRPEWAPVTDTSAISEPGPTIEFRTQRFTWKGLLVSFALSIAVAVAIGVGIRLALDRLLGGSSGVGPPIVVGPASPPVELSNAGAYFLALGPTPRTELRRLARDFGAKYGLHTSILPRIHATEKLVNRKRRQLGGESTVNALGAHTFRTSLHVIVIAITPFDMYSEDDPSLHYTFGVYGHVATFGASAISTTRMGSGETREHRLRVMVARSIGGAYFQLPGNGDRRSALYERIRGPWDLDRMTEDFCPDEPGAVRSC